MIAGIEIFEALVSEMALLPMPERMQPHELDDNPENYGALSEQEMQEAYALMAAGDRGAAYLLLAEKTGNPAFLNTAQISTGSGPLVGGAAINLNAQLQVNFPDIYPDISIEEFSQYVLARELASFERVEGENGAVFYRSPTELEAYINANQAWRDVNGYPSDATASIFPGNFFLLAHYVIKNDYVEASRYFNADVLEMSALSLVKERLDFGVQFGITVKQADLIASDGGSFSSVEVQGEQIDVYRDKDGKVIGVFRAGDGEWFTDRESGIGLSILAYDVDNNPFDYSSGGAYLLGLLLKSIGGDELKEQLLTISAAVIEEADANYYVDDVLGLLYGGVEDSVVGDLRGLHWLILEAAADEDIANRFGIRDMSVQNCEQAASDTVEGVALRRALLELVPYAIVGVDYSAYGGELELYDAETGEGSITNEWLRSRAEMLGWVIKNNRTSDSLQLIDACAKDGFDYRDFTSGQEVLVLPEPAVSFQPLVHRVYFGGDTVDTIEGQIGHDRFYGMGGNDVLKGGSGNDYLEGGRGNDNLQGGNDNDILVGMSGNDTLDGGQGSDRLEGGKGQDTYIFDGSPGTDTIIDDNGVIKFQDNVLQGGKAPATGVGVWRDDYASYSLIKVGASTDLLISIGDGSVIIKDWAPGKFGINLEDADAEADIGEEPEEPTPPMVIMGDLKDKDFDLSEPGIQTEFDDWGNVITISGDIETDKKDSLNDHDGDDDVRGMGGDDRIFASSGGNDRLDGGAGNDQIYDSGGGDDWIDGGAGNDLIHDSGGDADRMFGGADDDELLDSGGGDDWMSGGTGNDILRDSADGEDTLIGGEGEDRLFSGDDDDRLFGEQVTTLKEAIQADTGQGTSARGDWMDGGEGDDLLIGADAKDALIGGNGKDTLFGGAGDDFLVGDGESWNVTDEWVAELRAEASGGVTYYKLDLSGAVVGETEGDDDYLDGGSGNDWIVGQAGNDWLNGGLGNDVLGGGAGNDSLVGGEGHDVLLGDNLDVSTPGGGGVISSLHGRDFLDAGAGNDTLTGFGNDDLLFGGDGDDLLEGDDSNLMGLMGDAPEYHGNDLLDGGAGNDTLYGGGRDDTMLGGAGNDHLYGDYSDWDKAYQGNDLLDGGDGDDFLYGTGGKDTLIGGIGDDYLDGDRAGMPEDAQDADLLQGGAGNDTLWGGGGADSLYGGADNDVLSGDYGDQPSAVDGNDYLDGGDGDDTLWGNGGDDTLLGGGDNDHLMGGTGNNLLDGGAGNDYLTAQGGDDTYVFATGYGADTIEDSGGRNTVRFGAGMTAQSITVNVVSLGGASALVLGNSTGDVLVIKDYQKWSSSTFQFADGSRLTFAELMQRAESSINEMGSSGADSLFGSNWNDEVSGAEGDDLIVGQGGDDLLDGNAGNDTFFFNVGDGADVITDREGLNVIRFGAGIDASSLAFSETYSVAGEHVLKIDYSGGSISIVGGAYGGISQFAFADGSSLSLAQVMAGFNGISVSLDDQGGHLVGSNGMDTLRGGGGDDNLDAQGGNDLVFGGGGSDTINGGDGDDQINGEAGNDYLLGGAGNDTLIGGAGNDTLLGGGGSNTFLFQRANGRDHIITAPGSSNILQIDHALAIQDFMSHRVGNDLIVEHRYSDSAVTVKDFYLTSETWHVQHGAQFLDMPQFLSGLASGQVSLSGQYEREFQQRFYDYFANNHLSAEYQIDGSGRFYKNYSDDSYYHYSSITTFSSMEFIAGTLDTSLEWLPQIDGAVSLDNDEKSTVVTVERNVTQFAAGSAGTSSPTFYRAGVGSFEYAAGSSLAEVRDAQGNVTGWLVYPPNTGGAGVDTRIKSFEYLTIEYSITHKVVYGRDGGEVINVEVGNVFYAGTGNDLITLSTNPYVYEQNVYRLWGAMASGGAGDDTIRGSNNDDILIGGAGDDLLYGREGDDTYVIEHSGGVDVIVDSTLPFYSPNPEVPFGEGTLLINGWAFYYGDEIAEQDVLALPEGVGLESLQFNWGSIILEGIHIEALLNGKDFLAAEGEVTPPTARMLYTTLDIGWGSSQVVRVVMPRSNEVSGTGIELVRFADGATIRLDELIASAGLGDMPDFSLDGALIVDATADASVPLAGGGGNDTLQGSGRLEGWEGDDLLTGGASNDFLDGGEGSDTLVGGAGNDSLGLSREEFFGAGNTYLGGIGNDTIYGSREADIYRFSRGDGHDVVTDLFHLNPDELPASTLALLNGIGSRPRYQGYDSLYFESGIAPEDVSFAFDGADLIVLISGSDDSIRFQRWADYSVKPLNQILFDDGTVWDEQRLKQLRPASEGSYLERNIQIRGTSADDNLAGYASNDYMVAGSGNDYLTGAEGADVLIAGSGNDVLLGGAGNDELNGGAGSDIYIFARGDGQDVIKESVVDPLEQNILRFADGVLPEIVQVVRQGRNLVLKLDGGQDQIVVNNWFVPGALRKLDRVEFADGSSWVSTELESMALTAMGTSVADDLIGLEQYNDDLHGLDGDDLLRGLSGNDSLSGGAGDDRLYGDDGHDYLSGDEGADTIQGGSGDDRLIGGQGADYLDGGVGADTLVGGAGNDIFVVDDLADIVIELEAEGIDTVRSSVSYTLSEHLEHLTLIGNSAIDGTGNAFSNVIKGNGAANVLSGGQGNDSLNGGLGDDTYYFARGDGVDRVTDDDTTPSNLDRLIFFDVDHDQLWFRVVGDNLEVRVIGTGDRVIVSDWAQGFSHQLEQIVASDGVALGNAQVANLVEAMAAFAPPSLGQTTLPDHYRAALDSTITANWQ